MTNASRLAQFTGLIVAGGLAAALLGGCDTRPKAIVIQLKDHAFSPHDITLKANSRAQISVQNLNPIPAEFESYDMHVEKVVVPGGKISLFIGPLKPGTYTFFNDYDPVTTGTVHVTP